MAYIIIDESKVNNDRLIQENIALKKTITVLETANSQLKREAETYKAAYERWSNNAVIRVLKKVAGRSQ